jgi:hypothetical protein
MSAEAYCPGGDGPPKKKNAPKKGVGACPGGRKKSTVRTTMKTTSIRKTKPRKPDDSYVKKVQGEGENPRLMSSPERQIKAGSGAYEKKKRTKRDLRAQMSQGY